MVKVSLIMGIYNCQDTLESAIKSIINQTFTDWKLIMCDDASTDNTLQIAIGFQKRYPDKIIVCRNEVNKGLSASLNHCLRYAEGDYVARMDADDVSKPTRLEIQVKFLEEYPEVAVVGTSMEKFDENGSYGIIHSRQNPNRYMLGRFVPFYHATIMMRKHVYEELKGYTVSKRTTRGQDVDLWFRFYKLGYEGDNLKEALYCVRQDENAIKRRKLIYSIHIAQTLFIGFRSLRFPVWKYIQILKPIIAGCVPAKVMYYYHKYVN